MKERPISAGDVGRFEYCALNWKRSLEGQRGRGGEAGVRRHTEVLDRVDALEFYQRTARWTSETGFLLALVAISASLLGAEVYALRASLRESWILIFLGVVLLAGSLYLLIFNLYYGRRAREIVRTTNIEPGDVAFADSAQRSDMLVSRKFPLQGKPDYVVRQDGTFIPVELKTGKTPPFPYGSHVLQLAAYCQLVAEHYQARPPYGVLAYPGRHFRVPFTEHLEDELLKTLLRIQLAERTGNVHRSHDSPARCAGCSRREGCPERLDTASLRGEPKPA